MSLSISLRHAFPTARIDIAFEAPDDGVTALFGPSGSGKSTVIATVAGLLRPQACRIVVGGTVLADTDAGVSVPTERRRIGVVFQDSRLFPHMTVAANLRFGLRRTTERRIGFDEVVDLLDIRPLLPRRPGTLSGGERQRVAIGRALLAQPHLLLMDEPLASLDAPRKREILPYLARLKRTLRIPILYVTHSTEELLALADTVVLLEQGRVVAAGPLTEIATRAELALAQRDDAGAVLSCRVGAHGRGGLTRLDWGATSIWVARVGLEAGRLARVRLPAREVILGRPAVAALRDQLSLHNIVAGSVRAIVADRAGLAALVEIATPDGALLSRVTPDAVERLGLAPGVPVAALFKAVSVEVLGPGD